MPKCYIRNGVWGWPVSRQEKMLGDALDPDRLYQDKLTADQARRPSRINPTWLKERKALLRHTSRIEGIHVATVLTLAVSEVDLVDTLAKAAERGTTIVIHDSDMTVPPDGGATAVSLVMDAWQRAREQARTEPGRLEGVRVAAERKRKRTLAASKDAKPLWRDRSHTRLSTDEISAKVGLSVKTLYNELGRRPAVNGQQEGKGFRNGG